MKLIQLPSGHWIDPVGVYSFDHFEALLLINAIKQGMDQILLDHEVARYARHQQEVSA